MITFKNRMIFTFIFSFVFGAVLLWAFSFFIYKNRTEKQPAAVTTCSDGVCKGPNTNDDIFCGGIAGIACPEGYRCELDGSYPDAGGVCVKPFIKVK